MRDEDQERFTRLWTQAQGQIAGFVQALAPDAHAADDLLQDIAVALMRRFGDYDPSRPFIAWAMGVAKIQLLTLRRDRARAATRFSRESVEALAEAWQEVLPELDDRRLALRRCLESVQGRSRELLSLRYEQALEPRQIGERLGQAAGTVRVALSRLRAALQSCIERRLTGEA
jgi:RNA polymerase sigma-70 factor (ECF subfamily)